MNIPNSHPNLTVDLGLLGPAVDQNFVRPPKIQPQATWYYATGLMLVVQLVLQLPSS